MAANLLHFGLSERAFRIDQLCFYSLLMVKGDNGHTQQRLGLQTAGLAFQLAQLLQHYSRGRRHVTLPLTVLAAVDVFDPCVQLVVQDCADRVQDLAGVVGRADRGGLEIVIGQER